jgi:adenylate cyclase
MIRDGRNASTPRDVIPPWLLPASKMLRRVRRAVGAGRMVALPLLALLIGIRIWDPAPVEAVRVRTFDAFQFLEPRSPVETRPVVVVDVDEASLRALGQWPWPRTRVAELCRKLIDAGAALIAFDVVFAEPDRLSPPVLAESLPNLADAVRAELRSMPSNDDVLAAVLAEGRVILGQTAAGAPATWTGNGPPPQTGIAVVGANPDPKKALITFPGLIRNVPVLEQAAVGRGVFTISPERDGVVRRIPMIVNAGDTVVPTLALEIVRVLTGAESILIQTDRAGVASVRLPELFLPTDPRGQVWVRYSPHDPQKFVSAGAVLDGSVAGDRLRDKIVLIGSSALGLLDNRTTPLDRAMAGVEIHAQLLENLLTGATLVSGHNELAIELLVATVASILILVFAPIFGAFNILFAGSTVAAVLAYGSWYAYSHVGVLLDPTFPLATSFLVCLTIIFTNYVREQLGRTRIRSVFSQYLSPALVERLANSPEKVRLGGEERRLTVMFSDMRGFTAIAEFYKNDPAGLTQLVNRFLTPLTNAILDHKGTIDKYMGDGIMAFWNAPLDDDEHEMNAARSALEMTRRIDQLNGLRKVEAESGGHPVLPLDLGIGINTGACVVGNMGSDLRFDYTVLGDVVNIASRLEGQSKLYGVRIILGAATAAAVRDGYAVLEMDQIQVRGKTAPETIWTLVGDATCRHSRRFGDLCARHEAMIAAYRSRQWPEASARAGECLRIAEGLGIGGLYRLYQARAAEFETSPPPADWTGVYVALTK